MRNLLVAVLFITAFSYTANAQTISKDDIKPEMNEFMAMLKGNYTDVVAALAKFGVDEEIADDDMGMYNLKSPKVVAIEGDCVTIEAESGVTIRSYTLCWADGKINKIEGLGIKWD